MEGAVRALLEAAPFTSVLHGSRTRSDVVAAANRTLGRRANEVLQWEKDY
jgi:hypothetical protein